MFRSFNVIHVLVPLLTTHNKVRFLLFCIGSQLELALQAAPWCRGAGDSKHADVPLGGERPRLLFDLIYNV